MGRPNGNSRVVLSLDICTSVCCWAMSQEGAGDELNRSQSKTESARDQIFNQFFEVTDFQEIQKSFRTLCDAIEASECEGLALYASLKRELTSWKCRQLWKLLDERASLPEYADQKACEKMRVLVVGGGPVGLRAAIEAALLGARVDLVEKRTSFSRNNSLHLWPFLITDLRALGAKKFYGKFCAGAIDHICKCCITARMLMNLLTFASWIAGREYLVSQARPNQPQRRSLSVSRTGIGWVWLARLGCTVVQPSSHI